MTAGPSRCIRRTWISRTRSWLRWPAGRPTAAGEVALAQWGWALARDPEGARHWRPRARGVSIDSERGWRFRGRTAALTPDRVLAGPAPAGPAGAGGHRFPGGGQVRGPGPDRHHRRRRDPRRLLPPGDTGVLATLGSVSCAVHAKGKTALEVAEEIARAASARLPSEPEDLAPAIRDALAGRAAAGST